MQVRITVLPTRDRLGVIKFLREFTGCGPKEGKDAADSLWNGSSYRLGDIVGDIDPTYALRYYSTGTLPAFIKGIEVLQPIKVWPLGASK